MWKLKNCCHLFEKKMNEKVEIKSYWRPFISFCFTSFNRNAAKLKKAKNLPNNILPITQRRLLNYQLVICTYVCNNEYTFCCIFICMWHIFNRGADLAALVREASICALRTVMKSFHKGGQPVIVNKSHFDEAFVRVKPSVQAKVKINDHEKWFSCFSETV